ncbi:MAG: hypothetical protein IRY87_10870 [Acetobacteraceae bacterium]|nr:hypothetical protein [Acetobacteraceae bacterium]
MKAGTAPQANKTDPNSIQAVSKIVISLSTPGELAFPPLDAEPLPIAPERAPNAPFSRGSASHLDGSAMQRRLLGPLTALAALAALPAVADADEFDPERARAAAEARQIKPFAQLLVEVERRYLGPGRRGRTRGEGTDWTYKIKMLPPAGRMYRVVLNAATGPWSTPRGWCSSASDNHLGGCGQQP